MKRYVQHISGQGEKWELCEMQDSHYPHLWSAYDHQAINRNRFPSQLVWFPKSEYRECAPPERWVDVSTNCSLTEGTRLWDDGNDGKWVADVVAYGYRLRKVQLYDHGQENDGTAFTPTKQWAFIVEKRES